MITGSPAYCVSHPTRPTFCYSLAMLAASLTLLADTSRADDVLDLVNPFDPTYQDAVIDADDSVVRLAQASQPSTPAPASRGRSRSSFRSASLSNRRSRRLVRAPHMFGDTGGGSSIFVSGDGGVDFYQSDVPLAGSNRIMKASENNRAVADDRVYFLYNHFHSALNLSTSGSTLGPVSSPVDRYVMGIEKTIGPCWSVELRMPFTSDYGHSSDGFLIEGGQVGDLSIFIKRMIYESRTGAAVLGMGINTPTGSDVEGVFPLTNTRFRVDNDAVHLTPFLGLLSAPNDRLFVHGWMQVDVPLNGHDIFAQDILTPTIVESGRLTEQVQMHFDLAGGFWLCRTPSRGRYTGIAAVVEFHYTTTLEDADVVNLTTVSADPVFTRGGNRVDIPNMMLGLHAAVNQNLAIRVGGGFPLRDAPNRLFASEFHLSVIRGF